MAESMRIDLSEAAIARLTDRTEGWIAGLQLAALSLRATSDIEAFVEAFGATDRYIFDYLMDEALASQPPATREFLEATCVLDRLTRAAVRRGHGRERRRGDARGTERCQRLPDTA